MNRPVDPEGGSSLPDPDEEFYPHVPAWRNRLPLLLSLLGLVVVLVAGILLAVAGGRDRRIAGAAQAAPTAPAGGSGSTGITGTAGTASAGAQQPNWTTLINPTSGLSYQIPPSGWTTQPQAGSAGSVALTEGARRTPYQCGNPSSEYLRGTLGSGAAPVTDPGLLATSIANTVARSYYTPRGGTAPHVQVGPPLPTERVTPAGHTVRGMQVTATVSQSADPCLASRGEVVVLVLQLADRDAVLVVNGDLAGGPARPAPPGAAELALVVDSARPTSG